jgi:hypothetical protein
MLCDATRCASRIFRRQLLEVGVRETKAMNLLFDLGQARALAGDRRFRVFILRLALIEHLLRNAFELDQLARALERALPHVEIGQHLTQAGHFAQVRADQFTQFDVVDFDRRLARADARPPSCADDDVRPPRRAFGRPRWTCVRVAELETCSTNARLTPVAPIASSNRFAAHHGPWLGVSR